ncbi:MAG: tetratricopeptide repeat protein [Desulfobulbaceae bacterium]|nr:tetratricopeptide repeat protein [Desulfobulbaceae bacterium]
MNVISSDTDKALGQAFELFNNSQFDEAEGVYKGILAHDSDNPDAIHMLGVMSCQKGENDLAVERLMRAVAVHTAPPPYYFFNLAIALDLQGDDAGAVDLFKKVVELQPAWAKAQIRLGQSLQKIGDQSGAIAHYLKAQAIDPENVIPWYSLGNLCDEQGSVQQALDYYRAALVRRFDSVDACMLLGNGFNRHGCNAEALSCYRHALTFNQNSTLPSILRKASNEWLRLTCRELGGKVLSVGSGKDLDKEGGLYREYFSQASSYQRLDMERWHFPDIVGDIQDLSATITDGAYDVVFSVWALEHVPDVPAALAEIYRVLANDGLFVFGVPLNLAYHSFPHDYHRFTRKGIDDLFANKFHISLVKAIGPMEDFCLDPRLKIYGELPDTVPCGYVGIAYKI